MAAREKNSERHMEARQRLRNAGLRPTRQRLALAELLCSMGGRHLTAEQLHGDAQAHGISVSLATVYNTLHQFTRAGLLRELVVDAGRSYFDTNTSPHHHFFIEATNTLQDVPEDCVTVSALPPPPEDMTVSSIDIIIRVKEKVE